MINKSSPSESLKHCLISGGIYGPGAGVMQYIKNSNFDNFWVPLGYQTIGSGLNAYINMRIYDIVKKCVFSIIEDKNYSPNVKKQISNWSAASVCGVETFIVTYLAQELAKGDGSIELATIYALVTLIGLPTGYEKIYLEGGGKRYSKQVVKKIKSIMQKNV